MSSGKEKILRSKIKKQNKTSKEEKRGERRTSETLKLGADQCDGGPW